MTALFMVAKEWKQLRDPSVDKWMKHPYWASPLASSSFFLKRKDVQKHATTWIKFENITSECHNGSYIV
jgi:hypothetical protein